jgi:hypothetical protein
MQEHFEDKQEYECEMMSFVTSTEIFPDETDMTIINIRYDSCNVGYFHCYYVRFDEPTDNYEPGQTCTEEFWLKESWTNIRESEIIKESEKWNPIVEFFDKYHEITDDGTCEV